MNTFLQLQEIISAYAKETQQVLIWFNASGIRRLEDANDVDKLNQVYAFYKEFLPNDVYEEFFHSSYGAFLRVDPILAQDVAEDWFPPNHLLPDKDYYVYCCVFNKSGAIEWENVDPLPRQEDTE